MQVDVSLQFVFVFGGVGTWYCVGAVLGVVDVGVITPQPLE